MTGVSQEDLRERIARARWRLSSPPDPDRLLVSVSRDHSSHRFLGRSAQLVHQCQVRFLAEILDPVDQARSSNQVLDWGCGKGQMTYLMREQGLAVTSADVDSGVGDSTFAQATPLVSTLSLPVDRLTDATALPYADGSFDCVTSFGVLEHVQDDLASMREIRRILRPGGLLFIAFLPTRLSWTQAVARVRGHRYHDRLYTPQGIDALARQSGLRLIDCWYAQLFPKNSVPLHLGRQLEPLDRWLCEKTPLRYFATNLEIVLARPARGPRE